ncbi:hypothetical protein OL239_15755 [Arthrobacter sp. ATA002]|uniref:hypothetical protein n=1 Tax=Arthrobacter sp. ATA002 TaxID=2991715 RepID=UPI0022A73631|nr:hypothetical protein [Arthrobacter sp. ATA002]WAP51277.1 hypothetical protein OL239_15755 [Arthrobacter sp. ATA002]
MNNKGIRRSWIVSTLAFILVFINVPLASAKDGGGEGGGGFDDDDVYVGGYYQIPGSGAWGPINIGIPDDPNEYMFEYKCWSDDAGDIACLAENEGNVPQEKEAGLSTGSCV